MACSLKTTSCDPVHDALGGSAWEWSEHPTTENIRVALKSCEKSEVGSKDIGYDKLCYLGVVIYGLEHGCNEISNKRCVIPRDDILHALSHAVDLAQDEEDLKSWTDANERKLQLIKEMHFLSIHL